MNKQNDNSKEGRPHSPVYSKLIYLVVGHFPDQHLRDETGISGHHLFLPLQGQNPLATALASLLRSLILEPLVRHTMSQRSTCVGRSVELETHLVDVELGNLTLGSHVPKLPQHGRRKRARVRRDGGGGDRRQL